tara:strand:+ start:1113 stop:2390 length:1278 start_codon:yes stop_codon:yes gene_type:complete
MSSIHDDHSQSLEAGDPSKGRLSRKKAASEKEKPPSMHQKRKSVAKKLMPQELPETYEEYESMENKPPLRGDVEAGIDLEKVKPVAFKSREQSTKDAAGLAMRESEQQKKLDKFTSTVASTGRELSHYTTGDEYFGGKLFQGAIDASSNVAESARNLANITYTGDPKLWPKDFADQHTPEALTAIAAWALNSVGNKVSEKALDETRSGRLKQHGLDIININKGLKGKEESIADATFKRSSKQLKDSNKLDREMLKLIRDPQLSARSSEYLKEIKNSKYNKFNFLKNLQDEAYDTLSILAEKGVTASRRKEAREIADRLFKMGQKTLGKNAFKAAAMMSFPGLGALVSFVDHATSVFTRAKELPNQLAQNARASKRPLQIRDIEPSVLTKLKEDTTMLEDLYSRGVVSAKLYESLTESEESQFEGE